MLIGGVIVAIFIVLAAVALISAPKGKKPAQEYFQVVWSTFEDPSFPDYPDTTHLLILGVTFNITAVGGDAHGVLIESIAMSEPQEIGDMPKGQIVYVSINFGVDYLTSYNQTERGFPVTIRLKSEEADGELNFYIPFEM